MTAWGACQVNKKFLPCVRSWFKKIVPASSDCYKRFGTDLIVTTEDCKFLKIYSANILRNTQANTELKKKQF